MKPTIAIILIIIGIVCIPPIFTFNGIYETIGGFIGVSIVTFIPAYFLLRSKKKTDVNVKNKKQSKEDDIFNHNLKVGVFFILFCIASIIFYLVGVKQTEIENKIMITLIFIGFICIIHQIIPKEKK